MGHVAEADTGDAELLEGTAGAAVDDVAVTQTDRGRVAGQLLQAQAGCFACFVGCVFVNQGLLQLEALCSVTLYDDLALLVTSNLGLLSHV